MHAAVAWCDKNLEARTLRTGRNVTTGRIRVFFLLSRLYCSFRYLIRDSDFFLGSQSVHWDFSQKNYPLRPGKIHIYLFVNLFCCKLLLFFLFFSLLLEKVSVIRLYEAMY